MERSTNHPGSAATTVRRPLGVLCAARIYSREAGSKLLHLVQNVVVAHVLANNIIGWQVYHRLDRVDHAFQHCILCIRLPGLRGWISHPVPPAYQVKRYID
eukprot:SAG11_NODE_790_length_7155_cov_217.330641_4_plen_101_part_00